MTGFILVRYSMIISMLALALLVASASVPAFGAESTLPYTTRTRPFAGWGSTIRGDIRTLGLAGATVGLADTFIAAVDNPAGLAMTVPGVGIQITANRIHDGQVQDYEQTIAANHLGGVIAAYPWGFGLGAWTPHREDQIYVSPVPGERLRAEVFTREFRASAARVFLKDKVSLGVTLTLGQSARLIEGLVPAQEEKSFYSYAVGASFGAMFQLPKRWLVGINYSLPMRYRGDPTPQQIMGISNFFQPIEAPYRLGIGVGWIPNRLFSLGAGLYYTGTTPNAALAGDETVSVGRNLTVQPRIGATYTWAEFKEFEGKVMVGSYYESTRVEGGYNRLHATGGFETNPWVLNFGWGIDVSRNYANYIFSAGVNIIKAARKLDLVAEGYQPPRGGFLSEPTYLSDEGLARPLVAEWVDHKNPGIIDTVKAVPKRIEKKFTTTRDQLIDAVTGEPVSYEGPKPEPSRSPKKKKKPNHEKKIRL